MYIFPGPARFIQLAEYSVVLDTTGILAGLGVASSDGSQLMTNSSAPPDGLGHLASTDVVVEMDSVRFTPSGTANIKVYMEMVYFYI